MSEKLKLARGMSFANFTNNELMHGERKSSRTHKYIRKYQNSKGNWIYVYERDEQGKLIEDKYRRRQEPNGNINGPKYVTDDDISDKIIDYIDDGFKDGFTGDGKRYSKSDINKINIHKSKDGKSYRLTVETKDGHQYAFNNNLNKERVDSLADKKYWQNRLYGDSYVDVGGGGRRSNRR